MKKALLFVLLLLVALEAVTRLVLFPASEDFVRFATYSAKASALSRAPALRVAILGNSAAEEGIDAKQLERQLSRSLARPVRVELFLADGSEIVTWRAMLQHYFWTPDVHADVYVLNYFESLADRSNFEYLRVGMFFSDITQWPYYLRRQLDTLAQRIEFVLSSSWATYGARDRIRDRSMQVLIPGYSDLVNRLNLAGQRELPVSGVDESSRFTALESIIAHAREHDAGGEVVAVAFPLRSTEYEIEGAIERLGQSKAIKLLDMRNTRGLAKESYRDNIHLVREGRAVYTQALGAALVAALGDRRVPARRTGS